MFSDVKYCKIQQYLHLNIILLKYGNMVGLTNIYPAHADTVCGFTQSPPLPIIPIIPTGAAAAALARGQAEGADGGTGSAHPTASER